MGETTGEKIVRLEEQVKALTRDFAEFVEVRKARAAREWAVILAGLGLVGTVLAKNLWGM